MHKDALRDFARVGAERRIAMIRHEMSWILKEFPDLEAPLRSKGSPFPPNELAALGGRDAAPATGRTRTRRRMTAAQRKAVGERMRKYWAARKKAR